LALCSLENKDARARFGILKGLHSAGLGRHPPARTASCTDEEQNPGRGLHGVSGPHAGATKTNQWQPRMHRTQRRTTPRSSRGLDSERSGKAAPAQPRWSAGRQGRHQGSTHPPGHKDRAKGPLPQNEIVRVRSQPQGPIRERRASTASETEQQQRCVLHFSSKAVRSSAGDARATE
jgi:hypothetical protein